MLTNAGRDAIVRKLLDAETGKFTAIGVGSNSTPASATQVDLQATSEKHYQICDGGYPIRTGNKIDYKVTIGANNANFAWYEWGIFSAISGNKIMLNRVQENMSRKLPGQVWIFEASLTINRR